ncbi:MAG: hypothetical protein AAFS12_03955 [Cyanobacteria bacterium J06632_19]
MGHGAWGNGHGALDNYFVGCCDATKKFEWIRAIIFLASRTNQQLKFWKLVLLMDFRSTAGGLQPPADAKEVK